MTKTLRYHILLFCLFCHFDNAVTAQSFTEATAIDLGIAEIGSGNVCFVDINSDGLLDIWSGSFAYINDGNCNYIKANTKPVFTRITAFGDYNNDGYPDALSLKPNSIHLFKNSGPPTFQLENVDSISRLGFPIVERDLKDIAWLDINNDTWLDFYVSSYEYPKENSAIGHSDYLFLNDGNGSFSDISKTAGISSEEKCSRGISILDFNNDGYQDIYVSCYRLEDNLLWINQQDTSFVNVAKELGVQGTRRGLHYGHTIGTAVGDLDGNGCLDLFAPITHHYNAPGDLNNHIWLNTCGPDYEYFDFLFQNTFNAEIGSSPDLIDIDNDGDLDIFYINLYGKPGARIFVYENDGGLFTDITKQLNLLIDQNTEFALFADINCDQVLDIFLPRKNKQKLSKVFNISTKSENQHGVIFLLKGDHLQGSNISAYGSRIQLWSQDGIQTKELNHNNGNGYGSMMTPFLHFGLSTNETIDSIEVQWPSGRFEKYYDLEVDLQYYIKESQGISVPVFDRND